MSSGKSSKMTLYKIAETYEQLMDAIESGEIPEEAIADTLESVEGDFATKADNIACWIKNLRAEVIAVKQEATALKERAEAKERKVDSLTDYLQKTMTQIGKVKIETPRNSLAIRTNPPSVWIENEAAFIEWAKKKACHLLNFTEPTPNKVKIKSVLTSGKPVAGAALTKKERLVIK